MAKGLVLSLVLVLFWVLAQLVVVHTLRPVRIFNAMTLLFAPTFPAFIGVYALTPPSFFGLPEGLTHTPMALGLVNGLMVHLLLYCTWVEGFYCVDRPVTLRILVEFVKAPSGTLTLGQMQSVYSLEEMVIRRLESMQVNGYLEERAGRYVLTPKGRAMAGAIRFLRRALGASYYLEMAPPLGEEASG
ncbi:MAG: hypothetical protein ACE5JS_19150 [Nitrospinota bacterium]